MSTGRERAEEDRSTCTPCRGSGQVVSRLGGDEHQVTCPWCGGSGRFEPGRDAQEFAGQGETAGAAGKPNADEPAQHGDD
jgi:DnaJ-class molecular chaperone